MQELNSIEAPALSKDGITDQVNASFYGQFPYPWAPQWLDRLSDRDFARRMLNQDLGDWKNRRIPEKPSIWIAGCGTNQAVITALAFPDATILGTDVSLPSVTASAQTARQLGISNLDLRQESLNCISYRECFDYIICTGVIHHTAAPQAALKRLAAALKPRGILELMVYNRYHRIVTQPFQKAVRMLCSAEPQDQFGLKLSVSRVLLRELAGSGLMGYVLSHLSDSPDVQVADALLQPVEHSYTVETLAKMTEACGLRLLTSRISNYDGAKSSASWNYRFNNSEMQQQYESLDDFSRWEITNLLLLEKSPMLWFYCDRSDSGEGRKTDHEICEEFLHTKFVPSSTALQRYVLKNNGCYERVNRTFMHPPPPNDNLLKMVLKLASPGSPIAEVLQKAGIPADFITVNGIRLQLTTSASPYLKAVSQGSLEGPHV